MGSFKEIVVKNSITCRKLDENYLNFMECQKKAYELTKMPTNRSLPLNFFE